MTKDVLPKIAFVKNAQTYKLLANEKRLEILNNIKYEEKRVEELVKILGVSKANVSQHLALLRHAGIVQTRRDGLNIYYKIVDPEIIRPCVILYNLWVSGTRAHGAVPPLRVSSKKEIRSGTPRRQKVPV